MTILLVNYLGNQFPSGSGGVSGLITDMTESVSTKFVLHKLPAADKDLYQNMGKSSKVYTLKGITTSTSGSGFFYDCINNTGSIAYTSQTFGTGFLINPNVFFYDLEFTDAGSRPMERKFSLKAIQV